MYLKRKRGRRTMKDDNNEMEKKELEGKEPAEKNPEKKNCR